MTPPPGDAPPPGDTSPVRGTPAAHPAPRLARPTCPRCERPRRTCLCRWITPTDHAMEVLVLQHPAERFHAKGSARLLQLSLRRCRCEVGEHFDAQALQAWLHAPGLWDPGGPPLQPLLLYPAAPGGQPADPSEAAAAPSAPASPSAPAPPSAPTAPTAPIAPIAPLADPARWRLVLLDGTWRQAHRLLEDHAALQRLPRWPLPAPPPSRYAVRKARRADQRSTLEAACLALDALEGRTARCAPLLAAFDAWVAAQMAWRHGGPGCG